MQKRKTLSSFIPPLYSTAKTGQIITSEPATTTIAEHSEPLPLPELRTGDQLKSRKGLIYRVVKVNNPKRNTGFSEPLFRLERANILGHFEWTLGELSAEKMEIIT